MGEIGGPELPNGSQLEDCGEAKIVIVFGNLQNLLRLTAFQNLPRELLASSGDGQTVSI
jgi:hypothetical protein